MLSTEPPPGGEGTGVITHVENRKIKNKKIPSFEGGEFAIRFLRIQYPLVGLR